MSPTTVEQPQKLTDKVVVHRWPDQYTLMGASMLVRDLDDVADFLAESGFMRAWMAQKIREAMRAGEVFTNIKRTVGSDDGHWKGRADGVVAEYKLATEAELIEATEVERHAQVTGRSLTKKAQESAYAVVFCETEETIEDYDHLPRQARAIMDILNASGRAEVTEAAIEVLLVEHQEELKTRQDPIKIFAYYRKRLVDKGHLVPVEVGEDQE